MPADSIANHPAVDRVRAARSDAGLAAVVVTLPDAARAAAGAAFGRASTEFAIGGVAPLGHVAPMRTLIDRGLVRHAGIRAAAGHPRTVFRLGAAAPLGATGGPVADAA